MVCKGKLPEGGRKIGGKGNGCPDGLEIYSAAHYLTITGQRLPSAPPDVNERTMELHQVHVAVFGEQKAPQAATAGRPCRTCKGCQYQP